MLRGLQRLERRFLPQDQRPREMGRTPADAGCRRGYKGGESSGEKRRDKFLRPPQSGRRKENFPRRLHGTLGRSRKTRTSDFHPRFGLGVGRIIRRSDGYPRHGTHFIASVRGDGRDGGAHLVRRNRKVPEAKSCASRGRWRMGSLLATADGTALGLQRKFGT